MRKLATNVSAFRSGDCSARELDSHKFVAHSLCRRKASWHFLINVTAWSFQRWNEFHQVDLFKYRLWHLSHNIWHGKCYRRDIDPKIQRCLLPSCGCTRVCALLHDGKTLQLALLAYVVKCLNCVSSSSSPSVSLKRPIQFDMLATYTFLKDWGYFGFWAKLKDPGLIH